MTANIYGDKLTQGINGHGVDIAVQRADDLDKKILEHVSEKPSPRILDLGSGAGGQSVRMAKAGGLVTAVDIHDFSKEFDSLRKDNDLSTSRLQFIRGNLTELPMLLSNQTFEDCLSQRTFHYLPYSQALVVLSFLNKIVVDRIYISVSGLNTELGDGYPARGIPIETRWGKLALAIAKKHHIKSPVCLYTKEEFVKLLNKAGWVEIECWASPFGNIKQSFPIKYALYRSFSG